MTAKNLKHKFVSPVADDTDSDIVQPSDWNADHDLWLGYRLVAAANDMISEQDHLSLLRCVSSATISLPDDLPFGFKTKLFCAAGDVQIVPQGTINGSSATLSLRSGESLDIYSIGGGDYTVVKAISMMISLDDGEY